MPTLALIEYAVAIFVMAWAYLAGINYVRWLGGRPVVYAIFVLSFVGSVACSIVAIVLGKDPMLSVAILAVPGLLLSLASKALVVLTGGIRPEARVFESYRRIDRVNRGKPGGPKLRHADEIISAELQRLEELRTPATQGLIDAIGDVGRPWIAGEHIDEREWEKRKQRLWEAAESLWGPRWTRRL